VSFFFFYLFFSFPLLIEFIFIFLEKKKNHAVHIVGALTSVSGNMNDMLVHSYCQVAEMASEERKYMRSMQCYERLILCLRARPTKTEATLQLMQRATREIVSIKMIELEFQVADKVRKCHARHDPHKRLHEQNKAVFVKVIQTIMERSPVRKFMFSLFFLFFLCPLSFFFFFFFFSSISFTFDFFFSFFFLK
jgi:hypothetical protein